MIQKLVFGCVGYAAHFLSSLAPCACTMVARSRQKICAAALPNSQLLNHFRYIHESQLLSYLKLADCKIGLLINFNVKYLKEGIRRMKL